MPADLFLDQKVLNYPGDRYQLILFTLRWAKALKAKGSPEPMPVLIERALKEIVEQKISWDEILADKVPVEAAKEDVPAVVSVAEEGPTEEARAKIKAAPGAEAGEGEVDEEGKKKKKTKKKKAE